MSACQSLARLHRRVFAASLEPKLVGALGDRKLDTWRVGDLHPPSEWLQGVRPELALANVAGRTADVVESLLAQLAAPSLERLQVCLLLQHVAVEAPAWTASVRRLATRWQLPLPASPADRRPALPPPAPFRRLI